MIQIVLYPWKRSSVLICWNRDYNTNQKWNDQMYTDTFHCRDINFNAIPKKKIALSILYWYIKLIYTFLIRLKFDQTVIIFSKLFYTYCTLICLAHSSTIIDSLFTSLQMWKLIKFRGVSFLENFQASTGKSSIDQLMQQKQFHNITVC